MLPYTGRDTLNDLAAADGGPKLEIVHPGDGPGRGSASQDYFATEN